MPPRNVTVYQAQSDDNGGVASVPGRYFWTFARAKDACRGWGAGPAPIQHEALVYDDYVFLVADRIHVFHAQEDVEREVALAKLTPKERMLLGIGKET